MLPFHWRSWAFLAAILLLAWGQPARAQDEIATGPIEKQDFFREGMAPVRKAGPYDVTIVYFMDYQCPSCRRYTPDVARVLEQDRRLRVIYRDTPMLGPQSDLAARLAIASQFQGRHEAFHHALMTTKGRLDDVAIREAADKAGVDWARLQRDLKSREEDITQVIANNLELSQFAGISGTPAFIIGDTLANGALTYDGLKAEIADARRALGNDEEKPPLPVAKSPEVVAAPIENAAVPSVTTAALDEAAKPMFRPSQPQSPTAESTPTGRDRTYWPWLAGLFALLAAAALWLVRRRTMLDARRRNQ